jgi:hypothetical protein
MNKPARIPLQKKECNEIKCETVGAVYKVLMFVTSFRRRRLLLYILTSFVSRNRGCSKASECIVLGVGFLEKLAYALQEIKIQNNLTALNFKSSSYIDNKFDPSKANIRRNIITNRSENNLAIFIFPEYFTLLAFSAI